MYKSNWLPLSAAVVAALAPFKADAATIERPLTTPCELPQAVGLKPMFSKPCPTRQPPPPPPPQYGYATMMPKYYILSIVYAPPGLSSSNGFTNSTSTGTTSSISSNLAAGESVTLTASGGSLFGTTTSLGATIGLTRSSQDTTSFSDTYTSAQGAQLKSVSDQVDHSLDRVFLWLNPLVTITQTGSSTGTYALSTPNGQPMDVLDISVAELRNPALIPAAKLASQNIHGSIVPGLGVLDSTDMATILAEDPAANGTNVACTDRYVYVNSQPLEGPDFAGAGDVLNPFTETDAMLTATTSAVTHAYNTAFTIGGSVGFSGLFTLDVKATTSFSWSNTRSSGNTSGTSHQAAITFGTPTVGFLQWIDIYEDREYHTFAMNSPSTMTTCGATPGVATANGSATPVALQGTVSTLTGVAASNQLVVVHLSDGTTRRIFTDRHGAYLLYSGPLGLVDVTVGSTLLQTSILPNQTTIANIVIP